MVTYHIISWLQVCCPEFLGTFNNSVTRATEPVYAVSRWKHAQKQNTEKVTNNSNQRHDRCEKQIGAGGLGGRWGIFLARGGVLPWEAHQVKKVQRPRWFILRFVFLAVTLCVNVNIVMLILFRWRKGPIPALKDLEIERDRYTA